MAYKRISPQPVIEGGTGAITLTGVLTGNGASAITANAITQHGVVIGGASNAASSLGVASTGTVLTGVTGSDPAFAALSGIAVTFIAGTANQITASASTGAVTLSTPSTFIAPGSIAATTTLTATLGNITASSGTLVVSSPVTVANGGTGLATLTAHSIQLGNGTSTPTQLAVGATGTVLIGNTSADPSFSVTPTVTSITFGAGSALNSYTTTTAFTPVLKFGGATTGITYSAQQGYYVRIGNMITFSIIIVLSSDGSASGAATITGLPVGATQATPVAMRASTLTYTGTYLQAYVDSTGAINMEQISTTAAPTALTNLNFANTSFVTFGGSYTI